MNIHVLGSGGRVGKAWLRHSLGDAQPLLTELPGSDQMDLSTHGGCQKAMASLSSSSPDALVLVAAVTNVDQCESNPENCAAVNTYAVDTLARHCAANDIGLIFYSTDYVFDGSGPKGEDDDVSPLSVYGQSKVDAEAAIAKHDGDHLVVRINVPLCPPEDGDSFYSFVVTNLKAGKEIRVVTDQWSNPLDTDRIAKWSWEAWQKGVRGILHLGGGTYATRFDIARTIAEYIGAEAALIQPCKTRDLAQLAQRPLRGGLLIAKQSELFGTAPDLPTILKSIPK
jgi:dTDP-4-dehydrorhamnose reductase